MRPHSKQRLDLEPEHLWCHVAAMVCEARLQETLKGSVDAIHCPLVSNGHTCDKHNWQCVEAKRVEVEALELWSSEKQVCIYTFLVPQYCQITECCITNAILLEKWSLQFIQAKRKPTERPLPGIFVLQAIRSFLHFSQLTAWNAKSEGKLPYKVVYKIVSPNELYDNALSGEGDMSYELHTFPPGHLSKSSILKTSVHHLSRVDKPPSVTCPNCSFSESEPSCSTQKETQPEASEPLAVTLPPIPLPPPSISAENRLFDSSSDSLDRIGRALKERMEALRLSPSASAVSPVKFYISPENEREESPDVSPGCSKWEDSGVGLGERKRKLSQKILFSTEQDVMPSDSGLGSELLPLVAAPPCSFSATKRNTAAFSSFTDGSEWWTKRKQFTSTPQHALPKSVFHPSSAHSDGRKSRPLQRSLFDRQFSSSGLPLTSSPAPLKRNQHSFDFDSSLNTVSGLASALYHDHDSGSSDSEGGGSSHCKSAPASTNLLGNFEESALNGRIKPFGSIDGFVLDLAASGAFCPPHVSLPVTTFFFNLSDDNAPSPYLGHCSLENCSKKGYHLPKRGTVQATLFNPQGTVVKMFVVRYDLAEMPPTCQTFVRQRTFFMPSDASLEDARKNRSWLRFLIHLRFATSRSGKLYLHTDIRMLFSRKSELDAYNVEGSPSGPTQAVSTYELRSFNEMPTNPKFSPRKCTTRTNDKPNGSNVNKK